MFRKIKLKKNRACPQCIKHSFSRRGFVILFAVTLSAIILSITLGIADIALNEIKFGTSAKDSNEAFFAADTGSECALFNDKSTSNSFISSGGTGNVQCLGSSIPIAESPASVWKFTISGLGNGGQGCAKVTVDKTSSTKVTSDGYSNCNSGANSVARELETNY